MDIRYLPNGKFNKSEWISFFPYMNWAKYIVETVHRFLIKLGIKPSMHVLEISFFSLNHVIIVRPTKILNNLLKDCKIHTFKVIFQHQKSTESFRISFSVKNIRLADQLLIMNFDF